MDVQLGLPDAEGASPQHGRLGVVYLPDFNNPTDVAQFERAVWRNARCFFDVPDDAVAYALPGRMPLATIVDDHGRHPGFWHTETAAGTIFWIDLDPPANWGHRCLYGAAREDRSAIIVTHDRPPRERARFVRLSGGEGP